MEYYTTFKNKEILSYVTNMNEPWGHYAKLNKLITKNKYYMILVTYAYGI